VHRSHTRVEFGTVTLRLLILLWFLPPTTAPEASHLAGCLSREELVERLTLLRDSDWTRWNRKRLVNTWPDHLQPFARSYHTNEVVSFRRDGRIIDGIPECAEDYLFDVQRSPERLEQVTIAHVESSREAALAAIDGFAAAVNAPDDAGPSNMVCFDCGDPGQKMVDRLWTSAGDTHSLRVFLREGAGTVVINLEWARH